MMKSTVHRSGINKITQAQLFDSPKPLKPWMVDEFQDYSSGDGDKSIDRII